MFLCLRTMHSSVIIYNWPADSRQIAIENAARLAKQLAVWRRSNLTERSEVAERSAYQLARNSAHRHPKRSLRDVSEICARPSRGDLKALRSTKSSVLQIKA